MKRLIKKGKNNMKLVYALEDFPNKVTKSIFLAGPTPRNNNTNSWRKDALSILESIGYDGTVFIPEPKDNNFTDDYNKQIEWETEGLERADVILFWIPRHLENLPGFTTNIEWGKYQQSGKIVIGFPKDAPKNRYIKLQAKNLQININYTLEDTIKEAISILGDGAYRENGECYVPLHVWNTDMFKNWYDAQKSVGNELRYAKVNYLFKMPKARKVFLWILHVHVYIKAENRVKENEFVISRTDISSVVMYKKAKTLEDTKIVLIKEFRSPASNSKAMIYEVPGGSSINNNKDMKNVICDEIKEETGVDIDPIKLIYINTRQMFGTLSSHKCHLYSYELNDTEMINLENQKDIVHGVEEDTERTYVEIFTIKELLSNDLLDWSNIGYILSVLNL